MAEIVSLLSSSQPSAAQPSPIKDPRSAFSRQQISPTKSIGLDLSRSMSQDPGLWSPPPPREAKKPVFKPGSRAASIPTGVTTGFQSAGAFAKVAGLDLEGFAYQDEDAHTEARPRKRRKTEDVSETEDAGREKGERVKKAKATTAQKPWKKRRKSRDDDSVVDEVTAAPEKQPRGKATGGEPPAEDKKTGPKKQRRKEKSARETLEDATDVATCPKTAKGSGHFLKSKNADNEMVQNTTRAGTRDDAALGEAGVLKKVTLKTFRMPGASAAAPVHNTTPVDDSNDAPAPSMEVEAAVKEPVEINSLTYEALPADTGAPSHPMAFDPTGSGTSHDAPPLKTRTLHESFAYPGAAIVPVQDRARKVSLTDDQQPDPAMNHRTDATHGAAAQRKLVSPPKKYTTITARAIDKDIAARRRLQAEPEAEQGAEQTSASDLASFGFSASSKAKAEGQKIKLNDVETEEKPKRKRRKSTKPEKPKEKPLPEPAAAVARANRVDVLFGTSSQLREEDTVYRQDLQRAIEASEAEAADLTINLPHPELANANTSKALQRGSRNLWAVSSRGDEDSLLLPEDPEERKKLRMVPNPPHPGPPPIEIPSDPSSFVDIDAFEPDRPVTAAEPVSEPSKVPALKSAPSLPATVPSLPKSSGLRLQSATSRPTLNHALLPNKILQPVSPNKPLMSRCFTTCSPDRTSKARGPQTSAEDLALTVKHSETTKKASKKTKQDAGAKGADTRSIEHKTSKGQKAPKKRKAPKKTPDESTTNEPTSAAAAETSTTTTSTEPKKRGPGRPRKDPNALKVPRKSSSSGKPKKKKGREEYEDIEDLEAQAHAILEEISDSDAPSPSPPRRKRAGAVIDSNEKKPKARRKKRAATESLAPQLELSPSQAKAGADFDTESFELAAKEQKRRERKEREAAAKAAALEAERKEAEIIFPVITRTIKEAPRTKDPANPSWWEKMLLYDPIVLEDLTGWLDEHGVRYSDGTVLKPGFVQKWCESRSVCCLWKEGLRGGVRRRY